MEEIMKTYLKILSAALAVIAISQGAVYAEEVTVSARSAILIEASSGETVYEKNAHDRMSMASTTKIMTALVALENGNLDSTVKVNEKACGVEGSSIYLTPDEELTLEELLYALMLESANDAAAAIAYEIAGGIDEFSDMMNRTATRLGLSDTHFTNPHGLDNAEHYTTAADLAKLTAYALKNEKFREIVATKKRSIPLKNGEGTRVLINHNRLLRLSDDVIGVKTGFTKHSGRCLVSAAERDGVCVIAVTLNAPNDWNDHLAMHDLGFSEFTRFTLADAEEFTVKLPCTGTDGGYITVTNRDSLEICARAGTQFTHTVEADRLIIPPVESGAKLGRVVFYCGETEVGELPLYAVESVAEIPDTRSFTDKFFDIFR